MITARPLRDRAQSSLALVVALLALVIASTGITPAEAVRAVKRAAFATNSGAVNGIKASRTPRAGQLLPLGSDGRINPAVLPTSGLRGPRGPEGPAGARGAEGAAGARGPAGTSSARTRLGANALLGYVPGVETTVAALSDVAPGSYLVLFTGTGSARVAAVRGYMVCRLRINGSEVTNTAVIVGETAGATGALNVVMQFPVTKSTPFETSVTCSGDQPSSGEGFRVYTPVLTALKLDSVATG